MSEPKVLVDRRDHVLRIGLNRPSKLNGFDLQMYEELSAAYGLLEAENELHCGLLYASGANFTAGLDLPDWSATLAAGRWPQPEPGGLDPVGLDEERRLSKPMVVAAQGICFTIGIELMLAADVRVCADTTRFAQIEVKRGIYPVGGATIRMVQQCGWANAQRYLLTGDEFNAEEARRIGLVQSVVPAGEQVEHGFAIAARIAAQAPLAVYASLKSSRLAVERGSRAAIERLLPDFVALGQSDDAAEGIRSFRERRAGRYTGR